MNKTLGIVALVVVAAAVLAWGLGAFDAIQQRFEPEALRAIVARAGPWGPVLVVGLMCLAVVASPLPSAPIAVAAGAAYGDWLGTALVATGAVLGATIAFLIARFLGRDAVRRLLGHDIDRGLLGSQNALTLIVFVSRLMPFVSFDAISYAAGLSVLHLWRFILATTAGIMPASFVLAHLGAAAAEGDMRGAAIVAGGLGLLTGGSLLLLALRQGGPNGKGQA